MVNWFFTTFMLVFLLFILIFIIIFILFGNFWVFLICWVISLNFCKFEPIVKLFILFLWIYRNLFGLVSSFKLTLIKWISPIILNLTIIMWTIQIIFLAMLMMWSPRRFFKIMKLIIRNLKHQNTLALQHLFYLIYFFCNFYHFTFNKSLRNIILMTFLLF